jgi:hypothetical protein
MCITVFGATLLCNFLSAAFDPTTACIATTAIAGIGTYWSCHTKRRKWQKASSEIRIKLRQELGIL